MGPTAQLRGTGCYVDFLRLDKGPLKLLSADPECSARAGENLCPTMKVAGAG